MLRIERVGLTTVQDLGRPGWAHVGVPRSGAADRSSHRLANRLVGNRETAAGFETSGGFAVRALADTVVVLAGAESFSVVDDRPIAHCSPTALPAGATLRVHRPTSGVRTYVAVAGGVDGDEVLGSRSCDTLSRIVPVPLDVGTILGVGTATGEPTGIDVPVAPRPGRALRLAAGPHLERFTTATVERIRRGNWTVSATSDRVGVRLVGATIGATVEGRLESVPLVRGAVQLTPDDELIVMLADHPTTGGYPVVGVVDPDDVDALSQCPPGSPVAFRRTDDDPPTGSG